MSHGGMRLEVTRADKAGKLRTSLNVSDVEAKVLLLLRGSLSEDFSLSISRTGSKWCVMRTNRACGKIAPEFGTGSNFQDAWAHAGTMFE